MTTEELLDALLRPTYTYRTARAIADSRGRPDLDPLKRGAVTRRKNALDEIEGMLCLWAEANGYEKSVVEPLAFRGYMS